MSRVEATTRHSLPLCVAKSALQAIRWARLPFRRIAAATGHSLLTFGHLDSRFDPDDPPYGSCDDHSGEHLPTSGPSNDAPARGSSAFGPHATPSDRDGAPSGARAKSSGLTPARFSRHDEPLSRIDAAFSPAADPSGRSPAASAGLTRDSIGRAFDSLCRSRHQVRTTRHSVGLPPHSVRTPPRFEFPSHEADLSFHSR